MTDLGTLLGGLVVTLLAEWGYVAAFRGAFDAQAAALRRRPWASFGAGLAAAAVWTAAARAFLGRGAAHAGPLALRAATVPVFLAAAAGGAVALGAVAAALLNLDLEERPFLCVALGQSAAGALTLVPKLGVLVMTAYACAGGGAILLAELGAGGKERRLGLAGLACFVGLAAALTLLLARAP